MPDLKDEPSTTPPGPTYHREGPPNITPEQMNEGRDQGTVTPADTHIEAKAEGPPPADAAPLGSSPHQTGATKVESGVPALREGTFHREAPTVHASGAGTYRQDPDRINPARPKLPTNAILDHHFANIRDNKQVQNADGSMSSVKTIIVELDGKPTIIPTIWDGRELPVREAVQRAIKSGKSWPQFDTNDEADATDAEWHKYMSAPEINHGQGANAEHDYPYEPMGSPEQSDYTSETPVMQPLPKTFRQSAIDGLGEARDMKARHQEMINATKDLDYANES